MTIDASVNDDQPQQVSRGALTAFVDCRVTQVTSPSLFWVLPDNHISSQLRLKFTDERLSVLPSPQQCRRGQYVMAGRKELTWFYRAIIQKTDSEKVDHYCRVLLIDSGVKLWLPFTHLRVMPDDMYHYPWQAHPCCLHKLAPSSSATEDSSLGWTQPVVELFRSLVDPGARFRVHFLHRSPKPHFYVVKLSKRTSQADASSAPVFTDVSLMLRKATMKQKLALSQIECEPHQQAMYGTDFQAEPEAPSQQSSDVNSSVDSQAVGNSRRRRHRVPIQTNTASTSQPLYVGANPTDTRRLVGNQIRSWTVAELGADWFPCKVCLSAPCASDECSHRVTPSEFYVCPLLVDDNVSPLLTAFSTQHDHFQLLKQQHETFASWRDELDGSYADQVCRTPLPRDRLEALRDGHKIYAMSDSRKCGSARWLGAWRRVRVLSHTVHMGRYSNRFMASADELDAPEVLCLVRYEDVGGTQVVPLNTLYDINQNHCSRRPFAIQCRLPLQPDRPEPLVPHRVHNHRWPAGVSEFKEGLRADTVMLCRVILAANCHLRVHVASVLKYVTVSDDVFWVDDLRAIDSQTGVADRLVQSGQAYRESAAQCWQLTDEETAASTSIDQSVQFIDNFNNTTTTEMYTNLTGDF